MRLGADLLEKSVLLHHDTYSQTIDYNNNFLYYAKYINTPKGVQMLAPVLHFLLFFCFNLLQIVNYVRQASAYILRCPFQLNPIKIH